MNETVEIKIIEPILHYAKEFISPEEFNLYYKIHKDEMDKLTTHKLNKLYHIKNYRITKIKGELMLKKFNESLAKSKTADNDTDNDNTDLEKRIEMLEVEYKNDIEQLNDEIKNIKLVLQSVRDYLVSQS